MAFLLCGCGSDSSSKAMDASGTDGQGADDSNAEANVTGGGDASVEAEASPDAPSPEGGAGDTSSGDDGSADASTDRSAPGTDDGAADGGCITPSAPAISCGGVGNCNAAANYCLAGSLPNTCKPIPAQCACGDTHDCACLLANTPIPCDGGKATCTAYADGGQLWIFASNCH
jgi:hypothetical protein